MATIPERLTALERDQLAHEKENRRALEAHAEQNAMALEAVHVRINEVEQKMEAFSTGIGEVNGKLDTLIKAKDADDVVKGMKKERKYDFKDLVIILIGVGGVLGQIWQALK